MDANGQRFWLLADAAHWPGRISAHWDARCRALSLASERQLPAPANPLAANAAANSALERVPRTLDELGNVAYWNADAGAIAARSCLPGEAALLTLAEAPTDLAVGFDGVLYIAIPGGVRMHDLRGRWDDVLVAAAGFVPWRMVADPRGGVWVLERRSGLLARLTGRPLTAGPYFEYAGTTFRPDPENCRPPVLALLPSPGWSPGERPLALAHQAERGLGLLSWSGPDGTARLRFWCEKEQRLSDPRELFGARFAYGLEFVDAGTVVVRMPGHMDAPAFALDAADEERRIPPLGDIYPLAAEASEAPFVHSLGTPPYYPVALDAGLRGAEPLYPLSLANLARHGEARTFSIGDAHLIDSGDQRTVWHRLFAEARLVRGHGGTFAARTGGYRCLAAARLRGSARA